MFVNACSGASLNYVLNNAHSMKENLTNDDKLVFIAGANDLSDITPRDNQPARRIVDQVKRFLTLTESRRGGCDVVRFGRRLFALHLNVIGKRVLCGMIAASARRLRLSTIRLPAFELDMQLVSYADAVKSPLRTISRPSTEESARSRDTDVAESVDAPSNKS
ncbi:hypothetical protein J6590_044466 [Homalodisca vitripennis]|nr:hypothetical protein J6590_044466 [Homalodisca vitripennis]